MLGRWRLCCGRAAYLSGEVTSRLTVSRSCCRAPFGSDDCTLFCLAVVPLCTVCRLCVQTDTCTCTLILPGIVYEDPVRTAQ